MIIKGLKVVKEDLPFEALLEGQSREAEIGSYCVSSHKINHSVY